MASRKPLKNDVRQRLSIDQDINATQNRIPLEAELTTIRELMAKNQRLSHHILGELIQTNESLHMVKERENKILLELDSIRSERQALERFATILEGQRTTLQADIQRFAGLLHPIRRCPSDILRIIFQLFIVVENASWCEASIIRISHVCRRWRTIAIDTPSLWNRLVVPKAHYIPHSLPLLNMVFSRLRSVAPDIKVSVLEAKAQDVAQNLSLLFKASNVNQGDHINLLQLSLPSSSMSTFIDLGACFPKSINSFRIVARTSLKAPTLFYLTSFFHHFPLVHELTIYDVPVIVMEDEKALDTLKVLRLVGVNEVSAFARLSCFTNLATLHVDTTTFQDDMLDTDINFKQLRHMIWRKSDGIPWTRLRTPQLTRVESFSPTAFSEDVLVFLRRNKQICHFGFIALKSNFETIALVFPGLVSLEVVGHYRGLYDRSATGLENLPFRRLRHLMIITSKRIDDLEALVTARCHLTHASGPLPVALKSLTIRYRDRDAFEVCPAAQSWLGRCSVTRSCLTDLR